VTRPRVGCGAGQADHRRLAGRIGRHTTRPDQARGRGDVHNRARATGLHAVDLRLHAQKHAASVDGHDPIELRRFGAVQHLQLLPDPGVVDPDIDRSQHVFNMFEKAGYVIFVRNIKMLCHDTHGRTQFIH